MSGSIRPMRPEDLVAVERLRSEGFHELDQRTHQRGWPDPVYPSATNSVRWIDRTTYVLGTDPGGCWVAEDESGIVGFATSTVRELTWMLHTFVVRPGRQGQGIGRAVLEAAQQHGRGCLRAMLSASSDPLAVRRYRLAGFTLHPQMFLTGPVDRALLPVVEKVREGTIGDVDLMNSVDRQTRGSAHLSDHEWLAKNFRLVVSDSSTGSGYAYAGDTGAPQLLAATNRRTATQLLWEVLAGAAPDQPVDIAHVTALNEWAIDVGMTARMSLHQSGYLGLRGMKPPMPYLHHGTFL